MQPLPRKTLAEETVEALTEAIRTGTLSGILPGYRILCQQLGVSRTVLDPALAKLVEEGWLISSGPRKRYVTNPAEERERQQRGERIRKLWVLEPMERKQWSGLSPHLSVPLFDKLEKLGWTVEHNIVGVDQMRRHDRMWNQMLEVRKPDALLLVMPHRTTAEWAATCPIPVCAYGGDTRGLPLTMVGYESSHMVACALEQMLTRGHRDVCLLMSVRTGGFVARIYQIMESVLARHGITFVPGWHAPLSLSNNPEGIYELLGRRFALSRPTTLMCFGSDSLKTVMSFLLERGIAVPRDVSLVMLGDQREVEWFKPSVACFDFHWSSAVRFITRWLSSSRDWDRKDVMTHLKPTWIEGETLAQVQQEKAKRE